MLTLRQIEVVRAVMVPGSIAGAARLLNIAQPGISRTMKHLETSLGIKLFVRRGGRYVPSPEARSVFDKLQDVHQNLQDLQYAVRQIARGKGAGLSIAEKMHGLCLKAEEYFRMLLDTCSDDRGEMSRPSFMVEVKGGAPVVIGTVPAN